MAKAAAVEANEVPRVEPLVTMSRMEIINIFFIGSMSGLIMWGLHQLLNKYLFTAVLCKGVATNDCARSPEYALMVATVLAGIVGLFALVRIRAYRPLLVVIGSTIALWGLGGLFIGALWYWALLIVAALYGLAYALFSWLVRPRSFIMAVTLVVVAVVIGRLVLSA